MATKMDTGKIGDIWGDDEETKQIEKELSEWDLNQINTRIRMLQNNVRIMKSEATRLSHQQKALQEQIKDNSEKIKMNKQLPYLVANVVEV